MNDYQQNREKNYTLPQCVYRQALWAVKDLNRLKQRYKELEEQASYIRSIDFSSSVPIAGVMHVSDNTSYLAMDLARISKRIEAIEDAFLAIPPKYEEGIRNKLIYDIPYTEEYCMNTWKKWQQIFLFTVAMNLHIF